MPFPQACFPAREVEVSGSRMQFREVQEAHIGIQLFWYNCSLVTRIIIDNISHDKSWSVKGETVVTTVLLKLSRSEF